MKTRTYKQVEAAKRRAELASARLTGDDDRANEFADMSVEDYAELRGIKIKNPISSQGEKNMASRIKQLEEELDAANKRIEELEEDRLDALEALGVEIVDEDEDEDDADSCDDDNGD